LSIGIGRAPPITIQARKGMTQQLVCGDNNKNKFYICENPSKNFHISEIFKAFGKDYGTSGLLSNCNLNEVCFTSHQEDDDWSIKSQNLIAKKGLWLHAKGICNLGKISRSSKRNSVKIRFDTELNVYIGMEPILVGAKKYKNGTSTGEYALSVVKSKTSPSEGPTMVLTYGTTSFISGYIEGYGSCVVFEGDIKLKIQNTEPFDVILYPDPETGLNRRTTDSVAEYFSLSCTLAGEEAYEDSKCMFKINGDSLVRSTITYFSEAVNAAKIELTNLIRKTIQLPKKVEKTIGTYRTKAASSREKIANLTNHLQSYQKEFRKKSSLLQNKCSSDCNLVRTPGFKWDNQCKFSKSLSNSTCLKFSKDAHVAGDVHCVARCEIEQATTRDTLKIKYREAKLQIRELAQEEDLEILFRRLLSTIRGDRNSLNRFKRILRRRLSSIAAYRRNLQLLSMDSKETDITTALKPLKMQFNMNIRGYRRNLEFICDGKMDKRIAEFFIKERYGKKMDSIKTQSIYMETRYENVMNDFKLWKRRNRETLSDYMGGKRVVIPDDSPDKNDAFYINPFVSSLYTPKDHDNHKLVESFAPWDVLKRNHPIKTHIPTSKTVKNPNMVYRDSCHATRSKVEHFNDMVGYMKSWTQSYTNAKKMEATMTRNIKDGLTFMKNAHAEKRSKIEGNEGDVTSNYYVNKLEKGFETWGAEFSSQLATLNTMGPQLMKDNLKAMFVPEDSNSLENYIEEVSRKADVAYKKSFISNATPFRGIAVNFVKHLASNNTLEQLAPLVDEWDSMISKVDKRTISCHDSTHDEL